MPFSSTSSTAKSSVLVEVSIGVLGLGVVEPGGPGRGGLLLVGVLGEQVVAEVIDT
ncbi:hypothetical protein [Kitasatospora sp. NPDC054795]